MKKRTLVAVALVTACFIPQADAANIDSQRLLSRCKSSYHEDKVYCLAYIAGVSDALREKKHLEAFPACIPDSASRSDMLEAGIAYLRLGSDSDFPASRLLIIALSEAFPC